MSETSGFSFDPVKLSSGRKMSSYFFSKSSRGTRAAGIGSIFHSRTESSHAESIKMSGPVSSVIVERRSVLYLRGSVVFFSKIISILAYSGAYALNHSLSHSYDSVVHSLIQIFRTGGMVLLVLLLFERTSALMATTSTTIPTTIRNMIFF